MNISLLLIISILVIACTILIIKLYLMKKSIREIEKNYTYILKADTNNLITISSSDVDIKKLTTHLNNNLIELRKQKLQYQNGNKEIENIITNISHDLRTPLTVLKGYTDLIKNEQLSKNQKKYLNVIEKKANELIELTEQLFEFSKMIDIDTKKEKCCLNEILEEALVSFYNIFKEKNIVTKVSICSKKIYRNVNKIALIRIFENILSNVSKYSNGDFNLKMEENGIITFANKSDLLDETTTEKIFGRYFSVENAKESNGIGLAIAKQLVELNNGSIRGKYINGCLHIIVEI